MKAAHLIGDPVEEVDLADIPGAERHCHNLKDMAALPVSPFEEAAQQKRKTTEDAAGARLWNGTVLCAGRT